MEISLEQAIEIHAKVLKRQHKHRAPHVARERAASLKYANDHEGHDVWLRVAHVAARLVEEEPDESGG
jgi:hypothetical protein